MRPIHSLAPLVLLALASCAPRAEYVPLPSQAVRSDSLLALASRADTVRERDSVVVSVSVRGDTVERETVRYVLRERVSLRRDTLWRVRRDTVRVTLAPPSSSSSSPSVSSASKAKGGLLSVLGGFLEGVGLVALLAFAGWLLAKRAKG